MWIAVFCYSIIGVYCFYIQRRVLFFVIAKLLKSIKMSINYLINQMKEIMFVKNDEVLFLFRLNSFCFCVILKICKTFLKNIHDEVFKFFRINLARDS